MQQEIIAGTNVNELLPKKIICVKKNYFGETLKELRVERNLKQSDAAKLINITQAQWSAYELGKTRPDLDTIISIAKGFEVSPFAIIGRSLDKSKYSDPGYVLSFDDYALIEKNSIEHLRKEKQRERLAALS